MLTVATFTYAPIEELKWRKSQKLSDTGKLKNIFPTNTRGIIFFLIYFEHSNG